MNAAKVIAGSVKQLGGSNAATYHKDVYFPFPSKTKPFSRPVRFTMHASERYVSKVQALGLPKGVESLNQVFQDEEFELIEAYFQGDRLDKLTVRTRGPNGWDLVLVLACYDWGYKCLTLWLNHSTDQHTTLNTKSYVQG